jgi:Mg-chelatase subunit ChlD
MRKIGLIALVFLFNLKVNGQAGVRISPSVFDFGVVQQWKNDTAFFALTNTGNKPFIFLPLGYNEDIQVILPKGEIAVQQTVSLKVIYYTHDRGNFRRSIPIYISTSGDPIDLTLKGKIIDFHPDAMMNCPSLIDARPPDVADIPVEIKVVDAISGKGLPGFNLFVKNNSQNLLFEKSKLDRVKIDGMPNGKYLANASLDGYETKEVEILVTKNTRKFVIKLMPTEEEVVMTTRVPEEPTPTIVTDSVERDIERLRRQFNEKFKDKTVIEKDVVLAKEDEKDTLSIDTVGGKIADFNTNGTLNSRKYAKNNIVFLIDVSGSMDKPEKLPYLKKAVYEMVRVLRKDDLVTIITYAGKVNTLLVGMPGDEKESIYKIIDGLEAKGNSYGTEGMNIAYENARSNFIKGGNNQVILVSDGLFNSEDFSPKKLFKLSKYQVDNFGIITSCIGFGKNEDAINFMKGLASNGNGSFIKILSESDAESALVAEIMKHSAIQ